MTSLASSIDNSQKPSCFL